MQLPPPAHLAFDFLPSPIEMGQEVERFTRTLSDLGAEEIATRAALTLAIVAGAILVVWAVRLVLRLAAKRISPRGDRHGDDARAARQGVGRWTIAGARFLVWFLVFAAVLDVWSVDLTTGALSSMVSAVWRIGLIIVIASAVSEIAAFAISRLLERSCRRSNDARRTAQVRTIVPLLTGVLHSIVGAIALMMVLSEVGLDVGPLIAGAGVIGIALGFGAQTLVKDLLTGAFLIVEDIVSVGDIVRIGNCGGLVETMTLRTIRLRDFDGTLHVIPYGESQLVHNLTKTFSFYAFNLSIAYAADIEKALRVMRTVAEEMQCESPYREAMLEPIEVAGVDALGESGVTLKGRIKTAPAKQWLVGREYLKRIKSAFEHNGIEIPFPHIKLVAPDKAFSVDTSRHDL